MLGYWKQTGMRRIEIPVYDATTLDKYHAPLTEAVLLWGQSKAFQFTYARIDRSTIPSKNKYGIFLLNFPESRRTTYDVGYKRGYIAWADILWTDEGFIWGDPAYQYIQIRRVIGHEIGHVLGLEHVFQADGFLDPYDIMGSGIEVTPHDFDLLCGFYNCDTR